MLGYLSYLTLSQANTQFETLERKHISHVGNVNKVMSTISMGVREQRQ